MPAELVLEAPSYRQACVGLYPPRGHLVPHHRHRPRSRPRWHLLRPRRQPALPFRRLLRAGEPAPHEAHLPGPLSVIPRPPCRRLRQQAPRRAQLHLAAAGSDSSRRPHARYLQLRLLRALLPGTADGHRAGRRARPRRAGRHRLHAHHQGPRPRRRPLPPHRRRLPRPARLPPRLDARRPRPDAGLQEGPCRPRQRPRHRHRRRQGDLRLRAGDHQVLPRRRPHPRQRADLPLLARERPRATCWSTWPSSW